MTDIKKRIQAELRKTGEPENGKAGKSVDVEIFIPEQDKGDLTTNLAMVMFSQLKNQNQLSEIKSPRELAATIIAKSQFPREVVKVEVAGPGFINFWLSDEYFVDQLLGNRKTGEPENRRTGEKKKIMVEFTDPNPFKELHIGHAYSNSVGEAISGLLAAQGHEVIKVAYQGDVGMHVAKVIWGVMAEVLGNVPDHLSAEDTARIKLHFAEKTTGSLSQVIKYFGQAYARGATAYEESDQSKEQMKKINLAVFLAGQQRLIQEENWQPQVDYSILGEVDPGLKELVKEIFFAGRKLSLDYFEEMYDLMGMKLQPSGKHFVDYFFESKMAEFGLKIVREHLKKGLFTRSQGAIIYEGKKRGLHDRVFVNSLGLPTYETKELGLAFHKQELFQPDLSIVITGNEIDEYFKVLLSALGQIDHELAQKTVHMSHGMVRLKEGKMSSRTGQIVRAEDVIIEATQAVKKRMASEGRVSEDQIDETSRKIALGAVKYAFLKSNIGEDVIYDSHSAIALTGNTGPYLQYTFVRALSILHKANVVKSDITEPFDILNNIKIDKGAITVLEVDIAKEKSILRNLNLYSDILEASASGHAPHTMCHYLHQLASDFNSYYSSQPIVGSQNQEFKLLMVAQVAETIKHGLRALGIDVVGKM